MIRILLVHDAVLLRSALRSLLAREPDLEVVTASWQQARRRGRHHGADVWLMDADTPGFARLVRSGLAAPGEGGARAAVLVEAGRPGVIRQAHEAGVLGYVSKETPPERLVGAIRHVARGERYVDHALAGDLLGVVDMPLTRRELQVLSLAADGSPVAEIARSLWLAEGTVRNYLASIIRKTGARNRVDAIRISRGAGWV